MADLPPLATAQPLGIRLGYPDGEFPTAAEAARALALLVEASELIRDEAGMDWLNVDQTAVENVPPRVEKICLAAAFRAFDNPGALNQRQIGDSSKGYDRAGVPGGEAVYLTDSERRAVKRAAGGSTFTAVTMVSPYSGDTVTETLAGV